MSNPRAEFLAGERPDDVALFLADSYVSDDRFEKFGDPVENGIVMIVDGESGRNAFKAATDTDAMGFAKTAMQQEGVIADDLTDGTCPDADESNAEEHDPQFIFAFAEERNEDVGGIYAEGAVVHAYAQCTCGTAYSDRWNATDA
ncbi:DUF5807 family protein [Natronococcus wangiae]|uniref:DUF5807 family protein n=1 Tax=Natronococcus wangiae TaxID=3068275 RepID=UPI00273D1797|nr:DUF5807 family protein [Natronococcus sp. AD5]